MSLETEITRLAIAIERQGEGSAVAEILRQREYWKAHAESQTKRLDYYQSRLKEEMAAAERISRSNRGLRSAIKRAKNKRQA